MMKEKFDGLLLGTGRTGMDDLIQHLEEAGFYTSTCSGGNHLAKESGLLEHSINVCEVACQMRTVIAPEMPIESVIIASLLHDIGKAGFNGKPGYVDNVLKSGKISTAKPYATNKDLVSIPHQDLSLLIASKYIVLSEDEMVAIKYHNGLYTSDGRDIKGNETPLMLLVHSADMWASRVIEEESEDS